MCARYVKHLFEIRSEFTTDLCKIAAVGLLTEVVQDFHKPVTHVEKSKLNLYLDGRVALELLGVSGSNAAENIRAAVTNLQKIGCSVRVFEITLEEMTRALSTVLAKPSVSRFGPTADALRRNETDEAYVREIARDPTNYLKKYGVSIVSRKLDQYPNEHEYFDSSNYDYLWSRMNWHEEDAPRDHDSSLVAFVMRLRKGDNARDIFRSRHLVVTRNGPLTQLARRVCIDEGMLDRKSTPPIVHQRQLATAIWLRTGMGVASDEIPRRYVLSACERVLELKKSVLERVRLTAKSLTEEKAEQLDLLLTQDRSVQLLQDRTLGVSNVITPNNIELLVDEMKNELARDIHEEASAKISNIKKDAKAVVTRTNERFERSEGRSNELEQKFSNKIKEDKELVVNFTNVLNAKISKELTVVRVFSALLIIVLMASSFITKTENGLIKWMVIGVGTLVSGALAASQFFGYDIGVSKFISRRAEHHKYQLVKTFGLELKMAMFEISWDKRSHKFSVGKIRTPEKYANDLFPSTQE